MAKKCAQCGKARTDLIECLICKENLCIECRYVNAELANEMQAICFPCKEKYGVNEDNAKKLVQEWKKKLQKSANENKIAELVKTPQKIVVTGELEIPRDEIINRLNKAGHEVTTKVSGQTTLILCKDKSTNTVKIQEGTAHGIPIFTYDEFFAYLPVTKKDSTTESPKTSSSNKTKHDINEKNEENTNDLVNTEVSRIITQIGEKFQNEYPKVAQELFNTAIYYYPDNSDANFALANISYISKNYSKAVEYMQKYVHLVPDSRAGWYNLGLFHEMNKDLNAATQAFQHSLSIEKNPKTFFELGIVLKLQNKIPDAIAALESATEMQIQEPIYFQLLVELYILNHEIPKVIKMVSDNPNVQSNQLFEYRGVKLFLYDYLVITELESMIGSQIPQLRELSVSNMDYMNPSVFGPHSFGFVESSHHIKQLALYNKKLTSLPYFFTYLNELQRVNLSNNQLETLPKDINRLTKLDLLDLPGNPLKKLPKTLIHLLYDTKIPTIALTKSTLLEQDYDFLKDLFDCCRYHARIYVSEKETITDRECQQILEIVKNKKGKTERTNSDEVKAETRPIKSKEIIAKPIYKILEALTEGDSTQFRKASKELSILKRPDGPFPADEQFIVLMRPINSSDEIFRWTFFPDKIILESKKQRSLASDVSMYFFLTQYLFLFLQFIKKHPLTVNDFKQSVEMPWYYSEYFHLDLNSNIKVNVSIELNKNAADKCNYFLKFLSQN